MSINKVVMFSHLYGHLLYLIIQRLTNRSFKKLKGVAFAPMVDLSLLE